ncbi:integrating conjugative element protein [Pseudomonas sp. EGD-AK9]|jgi:integrating conjugative element protein (TIGR03765 family)|uniref:integrating conjugative element protein n=1 Tax=Pseudomonas sp. EGD-AK9 TaxID=1386078 RepID=UPI00039641FE|nr:MULTISPECIES: integrating conjugative element protein [Pseudomonas]ERI54488.1 integrating conjugative element protein [Pseudomonas sp. EGD-AK9]MDM9652375.1 integrating conjugative element protein [Pseudomonas wenzhouensis]
MKALPVLTACLSLAWLSVSVHADALIVVEDRGGASALPYYEALNLQPRSDMASPRIEIPRPPARTFNESDMLPVRSLRLSSGEVARRVIEAPGLLPLFLVGDDERSRTWLRQRAPHLREIDAVGLVVNVASAEALATLRTLVPSLSLAPVTGDDLAERLGLRHYPVLITATGIEQ